MKRKILVTGGSGFIGSNLVRFLVQEKGHFVVNLDKLTYAGNNQSLRDLEDNPDYSFEKVDLRDRPAIERVLSRHRPDLVMHLAAESHVDRSIDGPGDFIESNIVGTYNLLQACLDYWRKLKPDSDSTPKPAGSGYEAETFIEPCPPTKEIFRFLHVSTDEVYGSLSAQDSAFCETTPYDPHSPYSASKAASDHLARAWADTYGLPVIVTNCSNNYGPYQFPEKLIPVVILKCLNQDPIPVYGKGENVRDWLYVTDHVEALYTVATKGRIGETYNIGGNCEHANIDLIKKICILLESELRSNNPLLQNFSQLPESKSYQDLITFVSDRPGHDLRYAIDISKIKCELGWQPKEGLESGLKKTIMWYLKNHKWWKSILDGSYQLERLGQSL